jgi:hypothetical protein
VLTASIRTISSIIVLVVLVVLFAICVILLSNPSAPRRTSIWLGLTTLVLVRIDPWSRI